VLLVVGTLSGCVSKWAYDDQVEINQHLRSVKTEQDIERDGLHADVQALNRAYSGQSMRLTGLEGIVTHATNELKAIQTRLASMSQEQSQLRGEVTKLNLQASETLQFLRTINEQQQNTNATLSTLATKLDTLKRPAPVKTTKATDSSESRQKDAGARPANDERSAVQRAMDQRNGTSPTAKAPKVGATTADGKEATPTEHPEAKTSDSTGDAQASGVPKPADLLAAPSTTPSAAAPSAVSKTPESPADVSPLVRKQDDAQPVKPIKQTWGEWFNDLLGRKKTVQTAQQQPAGEKKDVVRSTTTP
jgi:hypothetical protein